MDMRFGVLGPVEVLVSGRPVPLGGPRPRALLAVLLVHTGRAVSTEHLIDQIWGEDPPASAPAALQVHASTLRKVLGDRLVTTPPGYLLAAPPDEVDALCFEERAAAARRDLAARPAAAAGELAAALALWRGAPFEDSPDTPDVAEARLRLAELRLFAQEDHLEAQLTLGRHDDVLADLARLAGDHPTRERLAGLHLLALHRGGRTADARAAYEAHRRALDAGRQAEPGAGIAALARAVDRSDPTLMPPSTIPTPASRFVGREDELRALSGQLREVRLLTLTGPGGAGKTRLALELARGAAPGHPDGAHVVELAATQAPPPAATGPAPVSSRVSDRFAASPGSPVTDRVAAAVGVREAAGEPLLDRLAAHLADTSVLFVLDNCEHLLDAVATVSAALLDRCPGVRIVATSREPLGVPGEAVWPLAGLGTPADGDPDQVAVRTGAVRLLVDRAGSARPDFALAGDDVGTAGRLCRRLDGLPLAIELAAAQLRTLSLAEVADRLGRRLDLADRRARTTPDRHRTMRAAIDWSYQLLGPEEQAAARALAAFADGCRVDAAEQVTGHGVEVLDRLVDRSVLTAEVRPDGTRYRMLELVHEYATGRLVDAGESDATRRRHAAWYVDLAAATAAYGGADHADLTHRLDSEEANLRTALNWCLGEGADPESAVRIAAPLWWYWWARGLMSEGRDWLHRALVALGPEPGRYRGAALRGAASLARNNGDLAEARALGEDLLANYRAIDMPVGVIVALNSLCVTATGQGDFDAALACGEESRDLAVKLGDEQLRATALNNIGLALRNLGRHADATAALEEAVRVWRVLDDRRGEAATLCNVGFAARQSGDLARSRELYMTSLALYRELDIAEGIVDILDALAVLATAEGRPAEGLRLLTVADRERSRLGSALFVPDELDERTRTLAAARAALGDRAAAVAAEAREVPLTGLVAELTA
ncbi:SARP family transcriptional regulator [Longispora fulva]|uniref:Putative ATPase/DNA-binding winged helix-turn-helix (WHTH) protein n=1 Tax=Longispora fulva TaxID=619741 RepID=A0A8J7KV71_9ACTN|nr:BTAD domain-containing putative transcriptional regulator [Longispora fulva]MBG6134927.1 putative ATPase/DNA-binding winged helix-turn-helix (wHTH) protein [Longispora fulva]GIG56841.1 SARP family transcriptional regulator [Longispora fulva]